MNNRSFPAQYLEGNLESPIIAAAQVQPPPGSGMSSSEVPAAGVTRKDRLIMSRPAPPDPERLWCTAVAYFHVYSPVPAVLDAWTKEPLDR